MRHRRAVRDRRARRAVLRPATVKRKEARPQRSPAENRDDGVAGSGASQPLRKKWEGTPVIITPASGGEEDRPVQIRKQPVQARTLLPPVRGRRPWKPHPRR